MSLISICVRRIRYKCSGMLRESNESEREVGGATTSLLNTKCLRYKYTRELHAGLPAPYGSETMVWMKKEICRIMVVVDEN